MSTKKRIIENDVHEDVKRIKTGLSELISKTFKCKVQWSKFETETGTFTFGVSQPVRLMPNSLNNLKTYVNDSISGEQVKVAFVYDEYACFEITISYFIGL